MSSIETVDIRETQTWHVNRNQDVLMTGAQFLSMRRRLDQAEGEVARLRDWLIRIDITTNDPKVRAVVAHALTGAEVER